MKIQTDSLNKMQSITSRMENDRSLLEILREEIESLDSKRSSNAYTPNEIMLELEHLTPRLLALCRVLINETNTSQDYLRNIITTTINSSKEEEN